MSEVEAFDASEIDLVHDGTSDEEPALLTDDEMLELDAGPEDVV